jgi:colanic acid biosynthesis glycosyl transferase WcaI
VTPAGRGRVLLVHRYFAPDTPPYASILSKIATTLAEDGHDVTVITGQPSYNRSTVASAPAREVVDGVRVIRWPVMDDRRSAARKVANLLWFCSRLVAAFRQFRRADVVMAATTPPVLVALVCSLLARAGGARFVYHKQDVWPEVLEFQGRRSGAWSRLLRRIDAGTEERSDAVVVLSEDMAETVTARGTSPSRIRIINNFDPWPELGDRPEFSADDALDIVFAGTLGAFQGVEALVRLVELTSTRPTIRWHFFGDGALRPLVQRLDDGRRVHVYGHRPPAEVASFVATRADLGVVSLNPGVIRAAFPSKTMTYLRNGCPLLTLVEDDSELARLVRDRQLGVAGGVDQLDEVAADLLELAAHPERLGEARQRAMQAYDELFAMERQLAHWRALATELVDDR